MFRGQSRLYRSAFAALCLAFACGSAFAQEITYPTRSIQLAVTSAERSPAFPAVPTLKELGLTQLEIDTWYGALAPAGTSSAVVAKVNAELNAALQQPDIRDQLAKQGMQAAGGTPERFGALIKTELVRWSRVIATAKIKAD